MNRLKTAARTDVGLVREKNEDSFWIRDLGDSLVLLVADGMGGAVGGQIASTTAVETVEELMRAWDGASPIGDRIVEIMKSAHQRIRAKGATPEGKNLNMGTTCTFAAIGAGGHVTFGHIGDSKLYHIRAGIVVQRSTDHSMLQRMLDAGALTPEEAKNYAHKNIIYKSLGGSENADIDPAQEFELEKGDALLLCSDGLSNYVTTDELAAALAGTPSLQKAAAYMVDLAKARGGDDNITVVLAEYGTYARNSRIKLPPIARPHPRKRRSGKAPIVATLLIVLIVLCSLLAYVLKEERKESGSRAPQTQPHKPRPKSPPTIHETRSSPSSKPGSPQPDQNPPPGTSGDSEGR